MLTLTLIESDRQLTTVSVGLHSFDGNLYSLNKWVYSIGPLRIEFGDSLNIDSLIMFQ